MPADVRERDFKGHVVGAAANKVRTLLQLDAFEAPALLRVLCWNAQLKALKGFDRTLAVDCGGLLSEVCGSGF